MTSSPADAKPPTCPICGKEAVAAHRPFCSKRCADVDLARWFTGSYAISGRKEDEGEDATLPDQRKPSEEDDEQG